MNRNVKVLMFVVLILLSYGCKTYKDKLTDIVKEEVSVLGINPIEVRVSHVVDGDTFVYEVDNHYSSEVNLGCGVDAYELKQGYYGERAKSKMEELLPPGTKVVIYPISMNSDGSINGLVRNHKDEHVEANILSSGLGVMNPKDRLPNVCTKELNTTGNTLLDTLRALESEGIANGEISQDPIKRDKPIKPWEFLNEGN